MRQRFFYGWVVVAVAAAVMFYGSGLRASYSVLAQPLLADTGWGRATAGTVFAVSTIVWGLAQPLAGSFLPRYGARKIIAAGLVATGASYLLLAPVTAPWQFYLVFGLLHGLAFACIGTVVTTAVIAPWFVRRRTLAMALPMCAWSLGQLLLAPAMAAAILHAPGGWRTAALLAGAGFFLLPLPLVYWLKDHPSEVGSGPDGDPLPQPGPTAPGATASRPAPAPLPRRAAQDTPLAAWLAGWRGGWQKARGDHRFWLMLGPYIICGVGDQFLAAHLALFAADKGLSPLQAGIAVGLLGGTAILGNLAVGLAGDRWGQIPVLAAVYGFRGLTLVYLLAVPPSALHILIFSAAFGLTNFATIPLVSALIGHLWGVEAVGVLFGLASLGHQIGGAFGSSGGGFFFARTGSYDLFIWLNVALLVVATALSLQLGRQARQAAGRPLAAGPVHSEG